MDLAVKDKTFAYLSIEGEPLAISCKLPDSASSALMLPNAKPTAYGLGKSGWVSITFEKARDIDIEMLKEWIDESYRAQAPKRLLAQLDEKQPGAKVAVKPKRQSPRLAVRKKR